MMMMMMTMMMMMMMMANRLHNIVCHLKINPHLCAPMFYTLSIYQKLHHMIFVLIMIAMMMTDDDDR